MIPPWWAQLDGADVVPAHDVAYHFGFTPMR